MKFVVTGATGYIGERLVRHIMSLGHEVVAASRRAPSAQIEWIPFDFANASDLNLPKGVDAVFHLAAATTSSTTELDTELVAAQFLIKAAVQAGARIIFVSSQTAREDAPTAYGRTKWQIERLILAAGGWVVRPGQVYGGVERALFGTLVSAVRSLPVIPAFLPAPMIYPIHVDDLVAALLQCAELNIIPSSVLCIGAITPVSFTDFLRSIARVRVRRFRLPIPIPVAIVRLVGVAIGGRLRAKSGLDRLTSLFDLPAMESERDMALLGVLTRPLVSGMTRSGDDRRRNLIREGQALLAYVLKAKASPTLVRRYVRCIESAREGQPIHLPEFTLRTPFSIALLDDSTALSTASGAEFYWRIHAAVVLAEASVHGARRFLAIGEASGFLTSLARVASAIALELWWRALRLVVGPALGSVLRNLGLPR